MHNTHANYEYSAAYNAVRDIVIEMLEPPCYSQTKADLAHVIELVRTLDILRDDYAATCERQRLEIAKESTETNSPEESPF